MALFFLASLLPVKWWWYIFLDTTNAKYWYFVDYLYPGFPPPWLWEYVSLYNLYFAHILFGLRKTNRLGTMAISPSSTFLTSPVFLCHASECCTEWMSDIAWNKILNFSNFYLVWLSPWHLRHLLVTSNHLNYLFQKLIYLIYVHPTFTKPRCWSLWGLQINININWGSYASMRIAM